jgi:hypothetical protein
VFDALTSAFPPPLVWGLFSRALGLVFLISFTSLWFEVVPLVGRHGIAPIAPRLTAIRRDFPGWRRFLYFPSLLWLDSSDRAIRAWAGIGVLASIAIIVGGPFTNAAFVVCYVAYLTLDVGVRLVYPWDCVLFEAGLFAAFLPALELLPSLEAVAAPEPVLAWVYRLLIFRVVFGFGKFKFLGSNRDDSGYLKSFMINQPLPSPVGWALGGMPIALHKLALVFMFVVEMFVPFLVFVPGATSSIVAAAAIVVLMVAIQFSGSFGFFNWVIAALCLTLLDTQTAWQLNLAGYFDPSGSLGLHLLVLLHTVGALMVLPFNSYCSHSWQYWPWVYQIRPKWLLAPWLLFRLLHPFRFLHAYGVFPPKSSAAVKCVAVFEVSYDGQAWHDCEFKYCPTAPTSRPRFAAPHHPRGDQAMIYETFGIGDCGVLLHSVIGTSNVYNHNQFLPAQALAQRILEGRPEARHFVRFPAGPDGTPPKLVRATVQMLERTSVAEVRSSGRWWTRTRIGPHLPETGLRPEFWTQQYPEPECWHWDQIAWLKRSRFQPVLARAHGAERPGELVLLDAEGLTADDVDSFWRDFVPQVTTFRHEDWSGIAEFRRKLVEKYTLDGLRRFQRVHGRLSFLLLERLSPLFHGQLFRPKLGVKSHFQLGMLTSELILDGQAAYDAAWDDPATLAERAARVTAASGLLMIALFRFDVMVFEAQKLRLLLAIGEPQGRRMSAAEQRYEATMLAIGERLFGAVAALPFLKEQFRGPAYEQGHPEAYPRFVISQTGEVVRAASVESDAALAPQLTNP